MWLRFDFVKIQLHGEIMIWCFIKFKYILLWFSSSPSRDSRLIFSIYSFFTRVLLVQLLLITLALSQGPAHAVRSTQKQPLLLLCLSPPAFRTVHTHILLAGKCTSFLHPSFTCFFSRWLRNHFPDLAGHGTFLHCTCRRHDIRFHRNTNLSDNYIYCIFVWLSDGCLSSPRASHCHDRREQICLIFSIAFPGALSHTRQYLQNEYMYLLLFHYLKICIRIGQHKLNALSKLNARLLLQKQWHITSAI